MDNISRKRRVALTVDVEAHTIRAAGDHVERLIWGRQGGREAGIGAMMDIADRHGVPMTFFLDYPEAELYGESLLDVGREIHRRGHDLEPHCHAEYLMKRVFGQDDMWAIRLPTATPEQSRAIVDTLVDHHVGITGNHPLAYRSGAYLLGANYLDALKHAGIVLDASYNLLCPESPMLLGVRGDFRWENGLRELPIPLVPYFRGINRPVPWNFNALPFTAGSLEERLKAHSDFLHSWFARHGDMSTPTLVIHSWSFWKMDPAGHFTEPYDEAVELFDALLAMLKSEYEVISISQLALEESARPASLELVRPALHEPTCPVCFEPSSRFETFNSDTKRRCPFCGSVERHRTLLDLVYAGAFGPKLFHQRDILHIAPGYPEQLLLRRMFRPRVTTLNILPGCDMQADIQAVPEIADNSHDIVLASEVFRHVRHMDKALAEIARILRPGALLLCSDCLENADHGREITSVDEQVCWYGREKLEQYGIGDFRRFGRKDWEEAFSHLFHTRLFKTNDEATGAPAWWLACVPKKDSADSFSEAILRSNAGRILHDAERDAISDFISGFSSWEDFRRQPANVCSKQEQLDKFKKAIFALDFSTEDRVATLEPDTPQYLSNYPTSHHPYTAQSWFGLLPLIRQDPLDGDSPQLGLIFSEAERWVQFYGYYASSGSMTPHTRYMVWHDTAAAIRLNIMAYALLRAAPLTAYDNVRYERLFRAMLDHYLLLCADHFFVKNYNHGLLQILGLLAFTHMWPGISGSCGARSTAAKRLRNLLSHMVGPDGIVREHSTEYHAELLPLLRHIEVFLTDKDSLCFLQALLASIGSALAHFIRPDGSMAPIGDTPPHISSAIRSDAAIACEMATGLPSLAVFPHSGYAFVRVCRDANAAHTSWLAMYGAFHSLTHKHCDDLAFMWSEGGQNILVDSGQQYGYEGVLYSGQLWDKGFYFSAPNIVYSESVHAHNAVEINGETYSRRVPPYGTLPLSGGQLSKTHWFLTGRWQRPEGFLQTRKLIFSPARWLLILDDITPVSVEAGQETAFSQWFHFDASIDITHFDHDSACAMLPDKRQLYCHSFSGGEISVHKGEFSPRLQGWQATEDIFHCEPAYALGVHKEGRSASFRTLFSLTGPCVDMRVAGDEYHLHFANDAVDRVSLAEI